MNFTVPELPNHLVAHARELQEMLRQTTPTYRPVAEERVREFEDNIARLQADIDAHRAAIALLEAQQEQLKESVRAGSSLLAPIRRMPQELLLHIFSIHCEDGVRFCMSRGTPWVGYNRMPEPVSLSMQLHTLSLDISSDAPTPSQILPLCTNLTELQFSIIPPYVEVDQNTQRFLVPTLQSLTVRRISGGCPTFPHFFKQFTFPGLTSLHIEDHHSSRAILFNEEDIACLVDFLRRSSSPLTTLSLACSHLSGKQAVRLLQHTPRLTSLHLNEINFFHQSHDGLCTPSLFTHFTPTSSSPPFLPHLSHLKIAIFSEKFGDEEYRQLIEAIRSRVIPDSCSDGEPDVDRLQSVEVEFLDRWATFSGTLAPWGKLSDAGLEVTLPGGEVEISRFQRVPARRLGRSSAPNKEVGHA
ncbi:hypothetical protein V5O48_011395 [Marasmius crinis-equi]|uniref:Uncharacterized protein n=1 Tax=Marasmius crinis-equi TaxID=585013 RepID=A0ABR3F626_9AGAR